MDDFSFDEPSAKKDLHSVYEKGLREFNEGSLESALASFSEIISASSDDRNSKNIIASAWYETGRCKLKLSKGREAMEAFRTVLKEYPDSDKVRDSLFLIGNILEQARQNDKALAYYKKVAAMSSGDSIGQKAESRIRELQKQAG